MKYLFNSKGKHVANLVNGQLHTPTGNNIGHYMESEKIFIDMRGRYLGEIVLEDRLMRHKISPYKSVNLGSYGNYGNVGNYGNPGNHGSIGVQGGFEDIPETCCRDRAPNQPIDRTPGKRQRRFAVAMVAGAGNGHRLGICRALTMKFEWVVAEKDERTYRAFVQRWQNHPFVGERAKRNVQRQGVEVSKPAFWKVLVGCLLTTQQRSGAGSAIERFLETNSQLLDVSFCLDATALLQRAETELSTLRFRRSRLIAKEIEHAATWLRNGGWSATESELTSLQDKTTVEKERKVARHLQEHMKGLGPKQSRNLIQWMGLSQYEVALDSRMIKVLRTPTFPVPLSATALADEAYYCFIEDGLQNVLAKISVLPCIFDACAFASGERNAQSGSRGLNTPGYPIMHASP